MYGGNRLRNRRLFKIRIKILIKDEELQKSWTSKEQGEYLKKKKEILQQCQKKEVE